MKAKATYLFVFSFALLFCGISLESEAQPSLGIDWEIPADTSLAAKQLAVYAENGIEYLQVEHPVKAETLELLRKSSFTVLVRLDKPFLTLNEIRNNRSTLLEQFGEITDLYRSYLNVAAIGLLTNSQSFHPDFDKAFNPVLDSLSRRSNKEFYFFSNGTWHYFHSPEKPFATLFSDATFQPEDITAFNEQFSKEVHGNTNTVFFTHSKWFNEAIASYPELSESIQQYNNSNEWEIPLPELQKQPESQSWMILTLVLLWVVLAILFKLLPYLRPMLLRYFLAHRFFVDDILHYRERAVSGGLLLMGMHAIFSGMVFYIVAKSSISSAGLDAFFHHLPTLAIAGYNYASFFVIGVILALLTQSISLLWLYLPAKNLEHFSQAVNLYAGTFFLDFLIVTILLTLYVTGFSLTYILVFGSLFVLVWYGAFNISAFDISRSLGQKTIIYLLLTIGLYTIITVGLLLLFLVNNGWIQIFDLAVSL